MKDATARIRLGREPRDANEGAHHKGSRIRGLQAGAEVSGAWDSVRVLGQENAYAELENRRLVEAEGAEIMLAPVTDRDAVTDAGRGVGPALALAAAQHEKNAPKTAILGC